MPDQEVCELNQTAVLWAALGTFDSHGETRCDSVPEEIPVRWVSRRREVTDPQGNTVASDVTATVDRAIPFGSKMWLGRVEDLPADFGDVPGELMVVVAYSETPDVKGRAAYREVMLARQGDTGPP